MSPAPVRMAWYSGSWKSSYATATKYPDHCFQRKLVQRGSVLE